MICLLIRLLFSNSVKSKARASVDTQTLGIWISNECFADYDQERRLLINKIYIHRQFLGVEATFNLKLEDFNHLQLQIRCLFNEKFS